MTTISIQDAQSQLPELIRNLAPGDEVVITDNNHPVARIMPANGKHGGRSLGTLHGAVLSMASDFDAPLDEFKDYTCRISL